MLIQFRVENHRSIRDERELSLIADGPGERDDPRLIHTEGMDEALLPAIALYGANASGKSNVLAALVFMRNAVLQSHRFWAPEEGVPSEPFALSEKGDAPSKYDVDIIVDKIRYRYGFILDGSGIKEEWLFAWPNRKRQLWFERKGINFTFGKNLHGDNETIRSLTRTNSLFLSAAAQNNHPSLSPIFRWFGPARFDFRRARLSVSSLLMSPASRVELETLFSQQVAIADNTKQREREAIIRMLQGADTGILDVRSEPQETSDVEVRRAVPSRRPNLLFKHRSDDTRDGWLHLGAESDGTITLLEMAPRLVRILSSGGLLCVDELEAGLHPMLAVDLLRLFHDPKQNVGGAQLVFTTHDTNLLGNILGESPLRRDQVWFTEKDECGATDLYPLTDFHPRKAENLERGYLQGRYGGVPYLGRLLPDPKNSEHS